MNSTNKLQWNGEKAEYQLKRTKNYSKLMMDSSRTKSIPKIKKLKGIELIETNPLPKPPSKSSLQNHLNPKIFDISDFKIGTFLGRGNFGEVYLATHKQTGLIVGVKKIDKMKARMMRAEYRIVKEIMLHRTLNHNNIIKLYNFFSDQDFIYLIMEVASDGCLYDIVKKEKDKKISEKKAKKIIRQLLDALSYLHKKNIIHRDLKPENILVSLVTFFLKNKINFF